MGAHRVDISEQALDPRAFRQKRSAKRREQPLRRGQRLSRSYGDLGAAQSALLWSEDARPAYAILDRSGFVDKKIVATKAGIYQYYFDEWLKLKPNETLPPAEPRLDL